MVYVTDVANALVSAGFSSVRNEVFNVGTGNLQSINTLVSLLKGEKIHIPKRPGEPDCTWADIRKIRSVLGWEPKVSLGEGLKKTIGYFRKN